MPKLPAIGNKRSAEPARNVATPRVLHVVWNLIRGGTEGQCARTAMALKCPVAVSHREGFFLEAVERACGHVYEMNITRLVGVSTLLEVRRLARHLCDDGIDLVHTWDADAAIFGSWAARLAGVPYITSRRDLGEIYAPPKAVLMHEADAGARAIVANAEAVKSHIFKDARRTKKVRVIPNILDLDEFDRHAAKKFSRADELQPGRRVALVTRLDPEKDVATFIRAAAKINIPDVSFVVAGDGMQRFDLEILANEEKLGTRIQFLGDVTDVPALLRKCSVGVLVPNKNEGLSNSILEYMAASLPVVATDCGGNRELVEHDKTGYIVQPGDIDGIARAIGHALQNGSAEMGRQARKHVETKHRPDVVAAQFLQLYRDVLGTG
jgi:glycosyltransferase involved in cell wall biosynthesis